MLTNWRNGRGIDKRLPSACYKSCCWCLGCWRDHSNDTMKMPMPDSGFTSY